MLQLLADDTLLEIASLLPILSLVRFLRSSKRIWNLQRRLDLSLFAKLKKLDKSERLKQAAFINDKELVDFFLHQGSNPNFGMIGAAEGGHDELVEYFVNKKANMWEKSLHLAVFRGHLKVVQFLIKQSVHEWDHLEWYCALYDAAFAGQKEIVELLFLQGDERFGQGTSLRRSNPGLERACEAGQTEVVEFFLDKGVDAKEGLTGATLHGRTSIVELLIRKGASENLNYAMCVAAKIGNRKLVELFASNNANAWDLGMKAATGRGDKDLVEYFISKGATNWEECLVETCRRGNIDLAQFFIDKTASNLNHAMRTAAANGHKALVQLCVERGANDFKFGLHWAITNRDREFIELFIQRGAVWETELSYAKEIGSKHRDLELAQFIMKTGRVHDKSSPKKGKPSNVK